MSFAKYCSSLDYPQTSFPILDLYFGVNSVSRNISCMFLMIVSSAQLNLFLVLF